MAKRSKQDVGIGIGKKLAEEAVGRRKEIARARSLALAKASAAGARRLKIRGSGRRKLAPQKPLTSLGTLIAEGDSWFDFPFCDVLSLLEKRGFDIESVARRGHTIEDMAFGPGQIDTFVRSIEKSIAGGKTPKALLLSGGGNDVAGPQLATLLNHARSGRPGLSQSVTAGIVEERVRDAYVTVLSAVTHVAKSYANKTIPILIHGYDYPVPDGRGFLGGFWLLPGPWLQPSFLAKGYTDPTFNTNVCRGLIDRFNNMLIDITKLQQFKHVTYINLRNVVPSKPNHKAGWRDELHPSDAGFKLIADKFEEALANVV